MQKQIAIKKLQKTKQKQITTHKAKIKNGADDGNRNRYNVNL